MRHRERGVLEKNIVNIIRQYDRTQIGCSCYPIERTTSFKYLGVTIDENLAYKNHIADLSSRARKLIFIMKKLRDCTPVDVTRQVYVALCQSILQYCVGVWGSAGKTCFITVERAQRALIKVIVKKPFRYSTDNVYNAFKVLRVRQLYVLNATAKAHKSFLNRPDSTEIATRRVFRLPVPRATSLLTRRSPAFAHSYTYNKISKLCDLKDCSVFTCKKKVKELLLKMSYDDTEDLI